MSFTNATRDLFQFAQLLGWAMDLLVWPHVKALFGFPVSEDEIGRRLRSFLDKGLVTRKLGQFLALRFDIIPRSICAKLDNLFDAAEAMPRDTIAGILARELGGPLEDRFYSFEFQPIASASVSQVHKAMTLDGQCVAVKVQRLGIEAEFETWVRNLRRLARISDLLRLTGTLSSVQALDEFADFTSSEFDFELEGRTADRLRAGMSAGGRIPEVRWDLTTRRVLTMEFIEGVSVLAICRLHEAGLDAEIVRLLPGVDLTATIGNIANASFHQLFDNGLFHGDPHPANILLRHDGTFAFVDCGIAGELPEWEKSLLTSYVEGLVAGEFRQSARYYLQLCHPTERTHLPAAEDELTVLLERWVSTLREGSAPVERRHIATWQGAVANLLRDHHVEAPRNLLLVWRAWMYLDSTVLRLPGYFDVMEAQARFFKHRRRHLAMESLQPEAVAELWQEEVGANHRRRASRTATRTPQVTAISQKGSASITAGRQNSRDVALTALSIGLALLILQPAAVWTTLTKWFRLFMTLRSAN